MSTHPALWARAAVAPAVLSGPALARRRPHSPPAADRLERLSSRLDVLIQGVRLGALSHGQHEAHVDEAEAIGAELRAVFRGGSPAAPTNAPLWQRDGRAIW